LIFVAQVLQVAALNFFTVDGQIEIVKGQPSKVVREVKINSRLFITFRLAPVLFFLLLIFIFNQKRTIRSAGQPESV
jgi:hypothetical protein